MKPFNDMVSLDEATQGGNVEIDLDYVAIFKVHNEKAVDNQDYRKYVYVAKSGEKYISGSETLYREYLNIYEEMDEEPFGIVVFRSPSRNYAGRDFLTCRLL